MTVDKPSFHSSASDTHTAKPKEQKSWVPIVLIGIAIAYSPSSIHPCNQRFHPSFQQGSWAVSIQSDTASFSPCSLADTIAGFDFSACEYCVWAMCSLGDRSS